MMTLEEASKILRDMLPGPIIPPVHLGSQKQEAIQVALSALRPVSRERVEKVWKGEWIGMTDDDGCTWYECSRCEHDLDSLEVPNHFCPACGAAQTDEAVEMVMERLKALYEIPPTTFLDT